MNRLIVLWCAVTAFLCALPAWALPMGKQGPGGSTAETAAAAAPAASHMSLILPGILVVVAAIAIVVALVMRKPKTKA